MNGADAYVWLAAYLFIKSLIHVFDLNSWFSEFIDNSFIKN